MIHQETHPEFVEGCFGCRIASVGIAASAMPTRHPAAAETLERQKRLDKDMRAYRAAKANGVQPMTLTGCADNLAMAQTKTEAEALPSAVKLARRFGTVLP